MTKAQVMALYPEGSYDVVPNDGMRKVVAARLTESKQTIPHFYLTLDCKIDALLEAREQINAAAPLKDGKPTYKLSVNDFVIKAWRWRCRRCRRQRHLGRGLDPLPQALRRRRRGRRAGRAVHAGGPKRRHQNRCGRSPRR